MHCGVGDVQLYRDIRVTRHIDSKWRYDMVRHLHEQYGSTPLVICQQTLHGPVLRLLPTQTKKPRRFTF